MINIMAKCFRFSFCYLVVVLTTEAAPGGFQSFQKLVMFKLRNSNRAVSHHAYYHNIQGSVSNQIKIENYILVWWATIFRRCQPFIGSSPKI